MTPTERQMLKNQLVIMGCFRGKISENWTNVLSKEIDRTEELFKDEGEIEEDCCDMDAEESNGGGK